MLCHDKLQTFIYYLLPSSFYGLFASQTWHFSLAESGFCNMQRLHVHEPPEVEAAAGLAGAGAPNGKLPVPAVFGAGRRASQT